MSTLYLIRHGQASFGADDYDVLSELGAAQARALGAYFAERGARLDACYVGPRRRHIDTAGHFGSAARDAGVAYPEPVALAELDEYPVLELLAAWMPALMAEHPEVARAFAPGGGRLRLEPGFRLMVAKWSSGELDTGELESYRAFHARVGRALDRIITGEGRNKRVAVFTSGGPIAMVMQRALGLADDVALLAGWVITNASISEFRYRDTGDLALVRFNTIPHLRDDRLITHL